MLRERARARERGGREGEGEGGERRGHGGRERPETHRDTETERLRDMPRYAETETRKWERNDKERGTPTQGEVLRHRDTQRYQRHGEIQRHWERKRDSEQKGTQILKDRERETFGPRDSQRHPETHRDREILSDRDTETLKKQTDAAEERKETEWRLSRERFKGKKGP